MCTKEMNRLEYTYSKLNMLWLLISIVLVSCSGDSDEGEEQAVSYPIAFHCGLQDTQEVSTRASSDLHAAGVSNFKVWAYKNTAKSGSEYTAYQTVMNGYTTWWEPSGSTSNTDDWEYVNNTTQLIKYWDLSAKAYRFMAVAPATTQHTAQVVGTTDQSLQLTFSADATDISNAPYFSELWFNTGSQYRQAVQMQFIRPVSFVRFMFRFADDLTQYSLDDLEDISFAPIQEGDKIYTKGEFTVSYPLTGTAVKSSWSTTPDATGSFTAFTEDYRESGTNPHKVYAVLPIVTQSSYILTVTLNGEERTAVVPAHMMSWQPGYEYTYVFKITEAGSVYLDLLQMAVHDWNEVNSKDYELYNW